MPNFNDDWTVTEILAALKEKNISISELVNKTNSSALDVFLLDKRISEALQIPLHELWPSRYMEGKEGKG